MKKSAFVIILLLLSTLCFAAKKPAPNPAEYTINVHVFASHLDDIQNFGPFVGSKAVQKLDVIMNGKKYELATGPINVSLGEGLAIIAIGDYKAKPIMNEPRNPSSYKSAELYELLFPDNTTMRFMVTGLTE